MHIARPLLATVLLTGALTAAASEVRLTDGAPADWPQASAEDYRSAVQAALAGRSPQLLGDFQAVPTQAGAIRFDVDFVVPVALAGSWDLRFGVDFGGGGAVFVDGAAVAVQPGNMWWDGSYADTTQSFQFSALLGAGAHRITLYGIEDCCNGPNQGQFLAPGQAAFTTFGSTDGLAAPVPEPAAVALWLAGLAALGVGARRRRG